MLSCRLGLAVDALSHNALLSFFKVSGCTSLCAVGDGVECLDDLFTQHLRLIVVGDDLVDRVHSHARHDSASNFHIVDVVHVGRHSGHTVHARGDELSITRLERGVLNVGRTEVDGRYLSEDVGALSLSRLRWDFWCCRRAWRYHVALVILNLVCTRYSWDGRNLWLGYDSVARSDVSVCASRCCRRVDWCCGLFACHSLVRGLSVLRTDDLATRFHLWFWDSRWLLVFRYDSRGILRCLWCFNWLGWFSWSIRFGWLCWLSWFNWCCWLPRLSWFRWLDFADEVRWCLWKRSNSSVRRICWLNWLSDRCILACRCYRLRCLCNSCSHRGSVVLVVAHRCDGSCDALHDFLGCVINRAPCVGRCSGLGVSGLI